MAWRNAGARRGPRLVCTIVAAALVGCGDDAVGTSGETDGGSSTGEVSASTSTTTDATTTTTSASGTDSESATGTTTSTTEEPTTEEPTTTTSTTTTGETTETTGVSPTCGDGVVDEGEECDDGEANDDGGACTSQCVAATCGDGLVYAGVEACDEGEANDDEGACTSQCAAATCGDGLVYAGVEACDEGEANDDGGACTSQCAAATCGDGLVYVGVEECDGDGEIANGSCGDGCLVACDDGFDDCNDDLVDGCEADLEAADNCGACGKSCGEGTMCTADGCCGTVTVEAAQSVSLTTTQKWGDNRVRAYSNNAQDIIGWTGYDLSAIDDGAQIAAVRAYLHHEVGFSNPHSNPVAQMRYSAVNDWTRAAAQPGDLTVSATVSATYDAFGLDAYNEFVLDPDAWDWSQDLVDDWLTIGIDEVAGGYRYVYFYGTDDPQTRPYVELDICE